MDLFDQFSVEGWRGENLGKLIRLVTENEAFVETLDAWSFA